LESKKRRRNSIRKPITESVETGSKLVDEATPDADGSGLPFSEFANAWPKKELEGDPAPFPGAEPTCDGMAEIT
jgi:hypothetical protein